MNNEYLWDKTGRDGEIEAFENTLRVFRHKEMRAPVLLAKPLSLEPAPKRKFLRLAFAFGTAAFAAIILLVFVWLQTPNDNLTAHNDSATAITAQTGSALRQPGIAVTNKRVISTPTRKSTSVRIHEVYAPKPQPIKTVAKQIKGKKPPRVKLTKDEEYAYDQLMLALSITSSKLKIVKDRINGIDEQNSAVQTQR